MLPGKLTFTLRFSVCFLGVALGRLSVDALCGKVSLKGLCRTEARGREHAQRRTVALSLASQGLCGWRAGQGCEHG